MRIYPHRLAELYPLSTYSWVIRLYYKGKPIIISGAYNISLGITLERTSRFRQIAKKIPSTESNI